MPPTPNELIQQRAARATFLRAQLDEDERVARRAFEYASPVWHLDEHGETVLWWPPEPHIAENERRHGLPVTADQWRGMTIDAGGARIGPHIVRHDPARTLRQVVAHRQIVDSYAAMVDEHKEIRARMRASLEGGRSEFGRLHERESELLGSLAVLDPVVLALASVYAGHDDSPGGQPRK